MATLTIEPTELAKHLWKVTPAATAKRFSKGQWTRLPHLTYISKRIAESATRPVRLIVNMPPGHGKSELSSRWTPVWYLANFPTRRLGLASYEATYAAEWGRKARDVVAEHGDALGLHVRRDVHAANQWQTIEGGGMVSAGVDGSFTGRRFHLIILDDMVKNRAEASSATRRQHVWDWWTSTVRTRLEPGGSIILVMTRWHQDDLVGRLTSGEYHQEGVSDEWEIIRFPAIAEEGDVLGREEGEPLWPERYDEKALAAARVDVGPMDWLGMYQQRPTDQEGSIFKTRWWQYRDLEEDEEPTRVFQYWDTAFNTKEQNDYTVCCTIAEVEDGYLVRDIFRARLEYPDLLRSMKQQYERWSPEAVFVENKASGISAVQSLRRETRIPVIPGKVEKDKMTRANKVTGTVEAGRVFLPKSALPWVGTFVDELTDFPNVAHDDQVDAFVGCLTEFINRAGGVRVFL